MSGPKKSPKHKVRFPSFAQVVRPDVKYVVQTAFTRQKQPIYLVNPETNEYVDGAINAPAIYLTFTPPTKRQVTRKAFGLIPGPPVTITQALDELKIDATLYFSYPGNEFFTGVDENSGVTVIVLQTWHDDELTRWKKIAQKVASELAIVRKNGIRPTVYFNLTSFTRPNDPDAPRHLIIKPDTDDKRNATPWIPCIFQDDDCYDE